MNKYAQDALASLPRAIRFDHVFTYRGKPIQQIKRTFATACRNAGIPRGQRMENGLIFHDLRRSFKTNMLSAGVDKVYRDTIVGHSLKGMDAHYLKPPDEDLKVAMEKCTSWFDDQFSNVDQIVDHKEKRVDS